MERNFSENRHLPSHDAWSGLRETGLYRGSQAAETMSGTSAWRTDKRMKFNRRRTEQLTLSMTNSARAELGRPPPTAGADR